MFCLLAAPELHRTAPYGACQREKPLKSCGADPKLRPIIVTFDERFTKYLPMFAFICESLN